MRLRILSVVAVTAVTLTVTAIVSLDAQALRTPDAFRARIDAIATDIHPAIIAIRRDIHMHPELGFRETLRAMATVTADYLFRQ